MARATKIMAYAALFAAVGALGCQDPVSPAAALVTNEFGITDIAVDDFFLYYAKADGTIKRVSLDGGPSTTIVSGIHSPKQIAVDRSDVYWTTEDGTLARVPKAGGSEVTLLEGEPELGELGIDDMHVYFTVGGNANAVRKASKDDCVADSCAVDTLADNQSSPGQLAVEQGWLYWGNGGNLAAILQMPVAGGSPILLEEHSAWDIAADGSYVYWLDFGGGDDGTVHLSTVDGMDGRVIASGQSQLFEVAGDGVSVYWTSTGAAPTDSRSAREATVSVASADGGGEATVLSPSDTWGPIFLALDATSIYWANSNAGTVFVRAKP